MESLNPLDQIQIPVILAVMGIVAATYFLLRRTYFAPYVAVMEEREMRLDTAESIVDEAQRIIAQADPEAQRLVAGAREKADGIVRRSREEDEEYRRLAVDAAMQESSRMLERGRAELLAGRESEVARLREQAIECVTLACDKLLGSAEPESIAVAVDKLLARRVY